MSRQLQRLVRSQILFREVNERVLESVGSLEGPLEFLCECSNEDCIETVALHLEEYEAIRSHPNLFVVTAGQRRRSKPDNRHIPFSASVPTRTV